MIDFEFHGEKSLILIVVWGFVERFLAKKNHAYSNVVARGMKFVE
ncbi:MULTISPECIES: hypothetical protein [Pelosinus]|nr:MULTISPECIES: hypothetical protein [Pelosinus]